MIEVQIDDIMEEWSRAFYDFLDKDNSLDTDVIWDKLEENNEISVLRTDTRIISIIFKTEEDLLVFKLRWAK